MEPARLASKLASSAGPFLGLRATGVPKSEKMLLRYPGWFSATFSGTTFFRSDPHRSEKVISWYFGPFWAAGTRRISGIGPKTAKHNFPVLGVSKRKTKVTTLSGTVVRNVLASYILTDQTPTGGKTRNTRIFGHFGLGRPLALEENRDQAEIGKS